jgi:hypothetical protein
METQITMMNVNEVKIGREYQRNISDRRLKKLAESMEKFGFWQWEPIVVNQDGFVIEGQHRVLAAKAIGIKKIPVSVLNCQSLGEEAEWFGRISSYVTTLPPAENWNVLRLSGHPYAKALYLMEERPDSRLYHRIKVKGHTGQQRIALTQATCILNTSVLGKVMNWTRDADKLYCQEISKFPDNEIIEKVNVFMGWFQDIWGEDKNQNPIPYAATSLRAIASFYLRLVQARFFQLSSEKEIHASKMKMKKFFFTPEWKALEHLSKVNMLISYWNKKRRKFILAYG